MSISMKVKQIESFDSSVINLIMGSDKIVEDQKAAPHKIKQSIKRTRPYTQAKTQAKVKTQAQTRTPTSTPTPVPAPKPKQKQNQNQKRTRMNTQTRKRTLTRKRSLTQTQEVDKDISVKLSKKAKLSHLPATKKVDNFLFKDYRVIEKNIPVVVEVEVIEVDFEFLLDIHSFLDYSLDPTYVFW